MNGAASRGLVVVRGAGDLASGVILRLARSGFSVVALEREWPLSVRRTVSFSEAIFDGKAQVEGLAARRVEGPESALALAAVGEVAVLVDPGCLSLGDLGPLCLVDATMAKRNLGTRRGMAPIVLALGPGFVAGVDADAVIETMRGHDLGRVIWSGSAMADTGVPGVIGGHGADRVIRAPISGRLSGGAAIGSVLAAGQVLGSVEGSGGSADLVAPFAGLLRGLLRDGSEVFQGLKVGDIDPRACVEHCYSVSDKALAVAGGVLEALLSCAFALEGGRLR